MGWLYPRFPAERLPRMIGTAVLGAVLAAGYGAAHDQLSYALSPEYFTRLKFRQFGWADLGWPPRAFASVVGVLGTAWVGLVAGWALARVGLAELSPHQRRATTVRAFALVATAAPLGGLIGWVLGVRTASGDLTAWADWQRVAGVEDLPAFVTVAYLHAGGYLGALVGLVLALAYVRRSRRTAASGEAPAPAK